MNELLALASQFGFPALIAVMVLVFYDRLVKSVLPVIERNTSVSERLINMITDQGGCSERIERKLDDHDKFVRERLSDGRYQNNH